MVFVDGDGMAFLFVGKISLDTLKSNVAPCTLFTKYLHTMMTSNTEALHMIPYP